MQDHDGHLHPLTITDSNRETLGTDREGMSRTEVGMREVFSLPGRTTPVQANHRPQAVGTAHQHERPGPDSDPSAASAHQAHAL